MHQLEILNRIAVNHDLERVELKKEINELLLKSGQEKNTCRVNEINLRHIIELRKYGLPAITKVTPASDCRP
jgi:PIN domain nuclease of toxin-antitoxin system